MPPAAKAQLGRIGACSLQTAQNIPSSLRHPRASVAVFGQPGQSHIYFVIFSSQPSEGHISVFIVT